jgi:hypothetical protein
MQPSALRTAVRTAGPPSVVAARGWQAGGMEHTRLGSTGLEISVSG